MTSRVVWCSECRTLHEIGHHLPQWLVWCEADGETVEDGSLVRAGDPESAAERWAEECDVLDWDYTILQGDDPIVSVMRSSERAERVHRYRVTGRAEPIYTAEEVE